MAQADPDRSPASHSMGVGSTHDGPGTGTRSPQDSIVSTLNPQVMTLGAPDLSRGYPQGPSLLKILEVDCCLSLGLNPKKE